MPIYNYKCRTCEHEFQKRHSMDEKIKDCPQCEEKDTVIRVPSYLKKFKTKDKKVGEVVKQFIKDASVEVAKEKKRMKEEEYKP